MWHAKIVKFTLLFIQAMQFDNFEDWNDTGSCINFKF